MLWLFTAQAPVAHGQVERFVAAINTNDPAQAMQYAKGLAQQQRMALGHVPYLANALPANDPSLVLLCVQHRVAVSHEGVVAGQTAPRPAGAAGPRDDLGFQPLGNEAVGSNDDVMFGEQDPLEGTVADVYTSGQEIKR